MQRAEPGRPPPAATVVRSLLCQPRGDPPRLQFPEGRPTPLPLFQLQGSQPTVNPAIQPGKDPWGGGELEVLLPPPQVRPQCLRHLDHTPSAGPARDPPDPLLQLFKGLACD